MNWLRRAGGVLARRRDYYWRQLPVLLGEWKEEAVLMMTFQTAFHNPSEKTLFRLEQPTDAAYWRVLSDEQIGGYSRASCRVVPGEGLVFEGELSTRVPEGAARSGYAGIVSEARIRPHDLEAYDALLLRVRGDGRAYQVNMRTRTPAWGREDIYQCPLPYTAGEWCYSLLPFDRFAMTWRGFVRSSEHGRTNISTNQIETVGVSIADRTNGPFRLEIHTMKAVRMSRLPAGLQVATIG